MEVFHNWCLSNRLTVNLSKTNYMLFSLKQIQTLPPLFYHENTIAQTHHHTLLGVTLDDTMTFKPHISNLILKLSRIVSLLYQLKDFMPIYVLKMLYNAHILPHLLYCTPIWCNTYPTHLLPVIRIQKKIIRIVTNSDYFAHTQPLFKETKLLKLFEINKLQIAIYMHKSLKTQNSIIHSQHNYETRTRENLRTPMHNLTLFEHSLAFSGPKIWNSIPEEIKAAPTLHAFISKYKQYITSSY